MTAHPLLSMSLHSTALAAAATLFTLLLSRAVRQAWKLRNVPGPLHCRFLPFAFLYHTVVGDCAFWAAGLHRSFGSPTVLIAPGIVSTSGLPSIRHIYGHGARSPPFDKLAWYSRLAQVPHAGVNSLISTPKHSPALLRRRIYQSLFAKSHFASPEKKERLNALFEASREQIRSAVARQEGEETATVDLIRHARGLSSKVVASQLFGDVFVSQNFSMEELATTVPEKVEDALRDLMLKHVLPTTHKVAVAVSELTGRLPGWIGAMPRCAQYLSTKASTMYRSPHAARKTKQLVEQVATEQCVVAKLAQAGCDDKTMLNEIATFFVAGTDTVSSTFACTVHLLLENPSILSTLKEELGIAFPDGVVNVDSLESCAFLDYCLKESMRMLPAGPGPFLRAVPDAGMVLPNGCYLPPSTGIFVGPLTSNNDESIYAEPDKFDPLRWKNATTQMEMSFTSFSSGPRQCIGMHLAWLQLRYLLATFFLDFDAKCTHDDMFHLVAFLSLRPASGAYTLQLNPKA